MDFSKVIIMTDLDGTLLDDKKQIAEKDLAAIEEFRKGGGIFTVATGRGYAMAEKVIRRLKIDVPLMRDTSSSSRVQIASASAS